MGTLSGLLSALLLCCVYQDAFAKKPKIWECEHAGREGKTTPFFRLKDPFLANMPCRYKMAHVSCGGAPVEVYLEKSLNKDYHDSVYMTGLVVNITTNNSDGSVAYQELRIDNLKFQKYLDKQDSLPSPWEYSTRGGKVDSSKKIIGCYDTKLQKAGLTVGQLEVLFTDVKSWQSRRHDKPTVEILCKGAELKALEQYPQTICGGPNNKQDDADRLVGEMMLEDVHDSWSIRDAFAVFTKQDVQQTSKMCKAMQKLVSSQAVTAGEMLYDCNEHYTSWGKDSRKKLCDGDTNRFKLYATCMGVMSGGTAEKLGKGTCTLLHQAADDCKAKSDFHLPLSELISKAGCPGNHTMPAPPPVRKIKKLRTPVNPQTCVTKDIKTPYWNDFSPGDVTTFFGRDDVNIDLPCTFKMASVKCGDVEAEVEADHAFDKTGRIFMSSVRVISTMAGRKYVSTISHKALAKYIRKQKFKKNAGAWKVKQVSGPEPQGDKCSTNTFDQSSKTGRLTLSDLTLTFRYFDPKDADRAEGTALNITCKDSKYTALEGFPKTVCGSKDDDFKAPDALIDSVPADPHHKVYNNDILILAKQDTKQKANPLCEEARDLVTAGGDNLGDSIMECFTMYRYSAFQQSYGRCLRQKKIDPFMLYVTCLRVLTDGEGCSSEMTCQTLQQVKDECGSSVEDPKLSVTELMQKANCTQTATA